MREREKRSALLALLVCMFILRTPSLVMLQIFLGEKGIKEEDVEPLIAAGYDSKTKFLAMSKDELAAVDDVKPIIKVILRKSLCVDA